MYPSDGLPWVILEKNGENSTMSNWDEKRRRNIVRRLGNRCVDCGKKTRAGIDQEIHHILPMSEGGRSNIENLCVLCTKCHGIRHNENERKNNRQEPAFSRIVGKRPWLEIKTKNKLVHPVCRKCHGDKKMGVRFYCNTCGKEIWQEMPEHKQLELTVKEAIDQAECSDCLLKRLRKEDVSLYVHLGLELGKLLAVPLCGGIRKE